MGDQVAATIGTGPDCTIRITDEYASARHCLVFQDEAGQVWVRDLGSTNGTHIRPAGTPSPSDPMFATLDSVKVVGTARLHPGDTLIVGRTQIPWTPNTGRGPIRVEATRG